MYRRISPSSRLLRFLTALITVWCLGCSSFDPLLARLGFGMASLGMECGSDDPMNADGVTADRTQLSEAGVSSGGAERVIQAPRTDHVRGYDCGCQSCHAASPRDFAFVSAPAPAPDVPASTPADLSSVAHQPLVPPPQSAL